MFVKAKLTSHDGNLVADRGFKCKQNLKFRLSTLACVGVFPQQCRSPGMGCFAYICPPFPQSGVPIYTCLPMFIHQKDRLIGRFEGDYPGPLVVVVGALHGNEPAGVQALQQVFAALEQERKRRPEFRFCGQLVGYVGHLQAFQQETRFLTQDLNRVWTPEFLAESQAFAKHTVQAEHREVLELWQAISAIRSGQAAEKTVLLDLHTTSADGGVFSIPTDEAESLELAKHLGAPAIVGLQASISGTMLGFAKSGGFAPVLPKSTLCVAFESGQHESQHSVGRAAMAVLRCLRAMGNLAPEGLADFGENFALPVLSSVPPVVRFRYAHPIEAGDGFKMRPGYVNFQPISQGEHLADDVHGPVLSPDNGLILMPLYQAKGSDGFFIVQ